MFYAAPAHFASLVAQNAVSSDHLAAARLLCLSGAAVPSELARRMLRSAMPEGKVIQLWGMSELQAGTFGRPGGSRGKAVSTAGAAVPHTELRFSAMMAPFSNPAKRELSRCADRRHSPDISTGPGRLLRHLTMPAGSAPEISLWSTPTVS